MEISNAGMKRSDPGIAATPMIFSDVAIPCNLTIREMFNLALLRQRGMLNINQPYAWNAGTGTFLSRQQFPAKAVLPVSLISFKIVPRYSHIC